MSKKFLIFHLTAVRSISVPNVMKFYRVVVEKHAPFREGRDGQKIIHWQFFVQLQMRGIRLGSHRHGENPAKFDFWHLETF